MNGGSITCKECKKIFANIYDAVEKEIFTRLDMRFSDNDSRTWEKKKVTIG